MNYLDSNLLTLNNNLLRSNFDRILDSIWVEVLEEIQDVLSKEEMVRPEVGLCCQQLCLLLQILKHVMHLSWLLLRTRTHNNCQLFILCFMLFPTVE